MFRYVTDVLLKGQPGSLLAETIQRVKKIRLMVKAAVPVESSREKMKELEMKLERCRNKVSWYLVVELLINWQSLQT